jgi:hypothetical protein
MKIISAASFVVVVCFGVGSTGLAAPQVPDVIVYDVGVNGSDTDDIAYYGQSGGIAGYSIATQSCNAGTAEVDWYTGGGDTRHPVIAQNMFRFKDGRFEQLGQSWLKHGFCAVSEVEVDCAPCQATPCSTLGIGCADTYWATLNDGASGRSKRFVNAGTGVHVESGIAPTGNAAIRGRLQVKVADIDPALNPGAEYFIEGQYVTADDHQAGQGANNASWRRVQVNSVSSIVGGGNTVRELPAIYAWREYDNAAVIVPVVNVVIRRSEHFFLGYRVTQLGPELWHYEYAIQNLTSDQSAGSFSVPVHEDVTVTNIGFHDVDYHSGDPYDLTDWPGVHASGAVTWATTPYLVNQNANALRWGTLYNWRFDADAPPVSGSVMIGLFKPGPNSALVVPNVLVPEPPPHVPGQKHQRSGPPGSAGGVSVPITGSNGSAQHAPITATEPAPEPR